MVVVTQTVQQPSTSTAFVTPVQPVSNGSLETFSPVAPLDVSSFGETGSYVTFSSPGGIQCGLAPNGARCSISSYSYQVPAMPAGQTCKSAWGSVFDLSDAGSGTLGCRSSDGLGGNVLSYGYSLTEGTYSCESRQSGMTCRNSATGHFFSMSTGAYNLG